MFKKSIYSSPVSSERTSVAINTGDPPPLLESRECHAKEGDLLGLDLGFDDKAIPPSSPRKQYIKDKTAISPAREETGCA